MVCRRTLMRQHKHSLFTDNLFTERKKQNRNRSVFAACIYVDTFFFFWGEKRMSFREGYKPIVMAATSLGGLAALWFNKWSNTVRAKKYVLYKKYISLFVANCVPKVIFRLKLFTNFATRHSVVLFTGAQRDHE